MKHLLEQKINHFNQLALKYKNKKRFGNYYWNEITRYINYFTNDDIEILEIGCGEGDLLSGISGKKKTGIDFSPKMIANAKEKYPDITFIEGKAENIELNKKFDLIILSNLVGYVDDIQLVFEQLHKVSHERTKIIVSYYNFFWEPLLKFSEWIGIKPKSPIQNWLTTQDINNLLYLAGFDVYRKTRQTIFPVYFPVLSALFNQYIGKLPGIRNLGINQFSFARPFPKKEDVSQKYSVSVVIPARNESGNIENAILRLPKLGKETEIIFIEGNSTDDTWETIQKVAEKYQSTHKIVIGRQPGKGKNDAVITGFAKATGDILMILDADLTVPPEDLTKFYNAIAQNQGDFINGSRLVYPMEKEAMRFLNLLGNKFFSMVFTWLLEQPFKDTLCGTKVIFREDYYKLVRNRKYFGDFDPFGDIDLIFGAHKLNLKIAEIPIKYRERTYGSTNISRFTHGFILLRMCVFAAKKIKFI
jgi:ubiquinone/menaquinone biosynthesis C-methylase UbiE